MQIQHPLAEQEPTANGSSVQANGTPQHALIAIALLGEQNAEESQATEEQQQFQARQVKPGVHKAENRGLQPQGALVAQQQAELTKQPAAKEQLFSKATTITSSNAAASTTPRLRLWAKSSQLQRTPRRFQA